MAQENKIGTSGEISNALNSSQEFASDYISERSYHELSDRSVLESDALSALKTNLAILKDLQLRLSFVMSEVRYQMKMEE